MNNNIEANDVRSIPAQRYLDAIAEKAKIDHVYFEIKKQFDAASAELATAAVGLRQAICFHGDEGFIRYRGKLIKLRRNYHGDLAAAIVPCVEIDNCPSARHP